MATQSYQNWVRAGRPWDVAVPIEAIGERLKAHGYTVYYLGADDASHLQADTPEDHCPFSVTPWPGRQPYPYILAMDIMPPTPGATSKIDGRPLPSLQQLGAQMRADKIAGHPGMRWLKYQNWEPERDYGGACWHDSWQPTYARRTSSDRGHIHQSGRTDYVTSTASNNYDPVARLRGEDDFMATLSEQEKKDLFGAVTVSYQDARCLATGSPTLPGSAAQGGGQPHWLVGQVRTLVPQVAVLTRTVEQLAAALQAGGSDLDTAAVLTRIDQRAAEDATRDAEQAARVAELELQLEAYRAAEAKAAQAQADALATRQS